MLFVLITRYKFLFLFFFFFSSRRRHTRCREVSWARRCVQETGQQKYYYKQNPGHGAGVPHFIVAECRFIKVYGIKQSGTVRTTCCATEHNIRLREYLKRTDNANDQIEIDDRRYHRTSPCLLYTSDAADDTPCVVLGGRRITIKKNKH
eukprot:TRINITY_DN27298_c0_g1_i1.p1 TRINITY_DN27298_c0_g1~~TRINITY_DN27298_c0_g1_i1.p1  ORF type:complete len:149 (-),score=35.77 TRINITY_DN27298_c0_g1_i1:91-537(-)